MSYGEQIFLAEEMANRVSAQVVEKMQNTLKEAKIGQADEPSKFTKTEEARPRFPHIINHYLRNADTWYEIMLPKAGIKTWSLGLRENHDINYCFEPSHSTFLTLKKGAVLTEDTAPNSVHAIYVKCSTANVTIEVELWREDI